MVFWIKHILTYGDKVAIICAESFIVCGWFREKRNTHVKYWDIIRFNPERRCVGKSEFPPNQQKVVYFTLGLGKESLLEG